MPPRLPARQSVELVQLGFLLPWAGIRCNSTTPAITSTVEMTRPSLGTSSHAESSTMAASRSHQTTTRAPSINTTRPTRRHPSPASLNIPQPTSVIHQYLSSPNPPPPSALLNLLRAHSNQLTLSSGKALSSYCIRMGDLKSYRGVWRLMGERRVATMSYVRNQLIKRFDIPSNNKLGSQEEEDTLLKLTESEEGGKLPNPDKGYRPNRWAMKMYPPLPTLPSNQRYTKLDLLRHLHYLLLQGDSPDFRGSLELYQNSIDWNMTSRDAYQSLAILNLYLAYLNKLPARQDGDERDGMGLIEIYLNDSQGNKVNKQTLHLLIKSLIPIPISKNSIISSMISTEPMIPPSNLVFIKNQILATISYFLHRHKIIPGPETYRIISNFAIRYKVEELAQLTWEGWNDSLDQEIHHYLSSTKRPLYPSSSSSFNLDMMNRSECGLDDVLDNPVIRFRRIGNYKKRWTGILQLYQEIGWSVKDENAQVEFSNEMNHGYVWLGEKGRLDKLAQAQSQNEKEKEKEKELKMEMELQKQSVMGEIKLQDLDLNLNVNVNLDANLDLNKLRTNDQALLSHQREEVKVNIQKSQEEDKPIIQIVTEPLQETISISPSASEVLNTKPSDETVQDTDNHHHKPPYFVLIRDGSTIKIKSRDRDTASERSRADEVEDKPVWE